MGVIALGAIAVFVGIMGCFVFKCMKPWCTVPFILFTLVCGILLIILGAMLAGFGGFYEMVVDGICELEGDAFEADYRSTVDKYTCSKTCPCPQGTASKTMNYWTTTVPTERLAASNRTADESSLTTNQAAAYRYHGDSADVTPLVFADNSTTTTYDNFVSCFEGVLEPLITSGETESAALESMKIFHDGGGFTALKWLED